MTIQGAYAVADVRLLSVTTVDARLLSVTTADVRLLPFVSTLMRDKYGS